MLTSVHIVVLFDALLLALGSWLAYQERTIPALSIFGAWGVLVFWQIVLASISRSLSPSFARTFKWESFFRPTHYVQASLTASIYTYLGIYWEGVLRYAPLILTQIIVGYLFDMLIAWSRGRVWRAGFGVVPIVFSINLFMWFKEPVFYLQLALLLLTFLGKEFVTWNYGGRRRHIFNPSALALAIASALLLATDTVDWTHALDITAAFDVPPNFYEVIFLLGLVVQSLFIVTPVTFGAAFAIYLIHAAAPAIVGDPVNTTLFPASVLLGMTFLVTDPATSPRSYFGRFLFGMAYGTGVVVSYILLRLTHQPTSFDKLLIVPIINLCVPLINVLCDRISRFRNREPQAGPSPPTHRARFGWLAAYVILFGVMLPNLKAAPSRPYQLLPPPTGHLSRDVDTALAGEQI